MKKCLMWLGSMVLLAGCGGGGGSAALGSSAASTLTSTTGDVGTVGTTVTSAVVHNPEPSTLILLGIGAMGIAARALKKRKK